MYLITRKVYMFFKKKQKVKHAPRVRGQHRTYKMISVTPEAHSKLKKLARKERKTMVETFSDLVGA